MRDESVENGHIGIRNQFDSVKSARTNGVTRTDAQGPYTVIIERHCHEWCDIAAGRSAHGHSPSATSPTEAKAMHAALPR